MDPSREVADVLGGVKRGRPLVVFRLDEQRYALDLGRVRRAFQVMAVTPLPNAPDIVLGIVDLEGEVVPVVDLRMRFKHPSRPLRLSDQLLVATTLRRTVALLVDETTGVFDARDKVVTSGGDILDGLDLVDGAVRLDDGLVLIHDLDRLLSLQEETAIDNALGDLATDTGDIRAKTEAGLAER